MMIVWEGAQRPRAFGNASRRNQELTITTRPQSTITRQVAKLLSTIKCHKRHAGPRLAAKTHGGCADIGGSYRGNAFWEVGRWALRYYRLRGRK
jgi:hypothetical protein